MANIGLLDERLRAVAGRADMAVVPEMFNTGFCTDRPGLAEEWGKGTTYQALQHMADTLDIKLCAKGIENQEQFEFFEEIGIFKGQGPLIGSVMSLEELKDYLKRYGVKKGNA